MRSIVVGLVLGAVGAIGYWIWRKWDDFQVVSGPLPPHRQRPTSTSRQSSRLVQGLDLEEADPVLTQMKERVLARARRRGITLQQMEEQIPGITDALELPIMDCIIWLMQRDDDLKRVLGDEAD